MNPWDKRFSSDEYFFGTKPAEALIKLAHHLIPDGDTLVVADGEGRNSVYLASKGFDVTATDFSEAGLSKARKLAMMQGVTVNYQAQDIYDTDWSEKQYDNVVAIFIQFVPPEKMRSVLRGLKEATKVGGTLVLHGYTPEQVRLGTGGPSNPDHMYTKVMLNDVYSDMSILINEEYQIVITEGKGHRGMSALIDYVGKNSI
jgi:cyclopropane fatty-acyl-phospholipid synthase-like methyltransferase